MSIQNKNDFESWVSGLRLQSRRPCLSGTTAQVLKQLGNIWISFLDEKKLLFLTRLHLAKNKATSLSLFLLIYPAIGCCEDFR